MTASHIELIGAALAIEQRGGDHRQNALRAAIILGTFSLPKYLWPFFIFEKRRFSLLRRFRQNFRRRNFAGCWRDTPEILFFKIRGLRKPFVHRQKSALRQFYWVLSQCKRICDFLGIKLRDFKNKARFVPACRSFV